jgi:tetratricopeptide (TPR) repeat protein
MNAQDFERRSAELIARTPDIGHLDAAARAELRRELEACLETADRLDAVVADRRMAELLFALGAIEKEERRLERARPYFDRARARDASFKRAVLEIVEIDFQTGRTAADDELEDLLDYVAFGRDTRVTRAAHLRLRDSLGIRLTDDPDDIGWRMELLDRLHRENPRVNYPKQYLGRGHYLRREYGRAIEVLNSFTEEKAESPSLLNMIGRSHEKLGELEAAAAAYGKSLDQESEQAGILFRLGRIKLKLAQIGS